jgi:hypothetical protein
MAPPPKKRGRPRKPKKPKEEDEGPEEEGAAAMGGAGPEDEVETLAILAGQGRVTVLTGRASAGRIWTEEVCVRVSETSRLGVLLLRPC